MVTKKKHTTTNKPFAFSKTPTGIYGLGDPTEAGFSKDLPTLICGGAGCGKTLLSMQFLIKGILDYKQHGRCVPLEKPDHSINLIKEARHAKDVKLVSRRFFHTVIRFFIKTPLSVNLI
jgi:hypothetical protein